MTDGLGAFSLGVVAQAFDGSVVLGRSEPVSVTFAADGRLDFAEVRLVMTRVPFPRPGLYLFRLLAGGVELEGGVAYLRVLAGEMS